MRLQRLSIIAGAIGLGLLTASQAHADDATILASCKADLQMSDPECACILDKVHSALNEKQLIFFVASIKKDVAAMQTSQLALNGAEMLDMGTFMATAPTECKGK